MLVGYSTPNEDDVGGLYRLDTEQLRGATHRFVVASLDVWMPDKQHPVDLAEVEERIVELHRYYNRAPVVADPWNGAFMYQRLRRAGVPVEEYTFTQASVGRLARNLHLLLRDGMVQLIDHPMLVEELRTVRLLNRGLVYGRSSTTPAGTPTTAMAPALAAHKSLTIEQSRLDRAIRPR